VVPELANQVGNVRVLLVGDVSASEADRAYRASLPHQNHPVVQFLGLRHDIPQIMKSLDILVAPSRHEGMGRVLVEAMACRKPVVAARTGGMQEVVVDGVTGLLFDGNRPDELLDRLLTLCRSISSRARMGQAGRERMERVFNQEIQIQKVLKRLVSLLGVRGDL
jgi:glycosyltransferase involved in cell wall biosynthesis